MIQSWNVLVIFPKELFVSYWILLVLVRIIIKVIYMLFVNKIHGNLSMAEFLFWSIEATLNRSTTSQILTIYLILRVHAKNLDTTISFVDFSQAFDSIDRGKVEKILLGLPKETVAAIMMLYKNTKFKSPFLVWRQDYCCIVIC